MCVLARLGAFTPAVNIDEFIITGTKAPCCALLSRWCLFFVVTVVLLIFCYYTFSFLVTLLQFSSAYSSLRLILILITIILLLLSRDSASNVHSSFLYTPLLKAGSFGGDIFGRLITLAPYQQHIYSVHYGAQLVMYTLSFGRISKGGDIYGHCYGTMGELPYS